MLDLWWTYFINIKIVYWHRLKNKNDLTQLTTVNGCMKIYNANTNQKKAAVTVLHLESADFKARELSKD